MATLQAASKSGIEMTFQIEESELVAVAKGPPTPSPVDEAARVVVIFTGRSPSPRLWPKLELPPCV